MGVIIPFVNYVVPWLFMNEKWKGSDQEHPPTSPEWKAARPSSMVNVWWALALGAAAIALIGGGDVTPEILNTIIDDLTSRAAAAGPLWQEVAV